MIAKKDPLFIFDISEIEEIVKKISNDEKSYLKKGFYYYHLEKYWEAYNCFEIASINAFRKKNFVIWFLLEFNKRKIAPLLRYSEEYFRNRDSNDKLKTKTFLQIENIIKHAIKEDLFDLFIKLPKSYQKVLKPLLKLETRIQNAFLKSFFKAEDAKKAGNRWDYNVPELWYFIDDFIRLSHFWYLCIEHNSYEMFRKTFEAAVYEFKHKKMPVFYYHFAYSGIIGFNKWEEVDKFLSQTLEKETLKFYENEKGLYWRALENLFKIYVQSSNLYTKYDKFFRNLLVILGFYPLTKSEVENIGKLFIKILWERKMILDDYRLIEWFLIKHDKKLGDNFLTKIVDVYLKKFMCSKFNFYDLVSVYHTNVFSTIFHLMKIRGITYNKKEEIIFYLNTIKSWDIETKFQIYTYFFFGLYYVVDSEEIKEYLKKELIKFRKKLEEKYKSSLEQCSLEKQNFIIYYFIYSIWLMVLGVVEIEESFLDEMKIYLSNYKNYNSLINNLYIALKNLKEKVKEKSILQKIQIILDLIKNLVYSIKRPFSGGKY